VAFIKNIKGKIYNNIYLFFATSERFEVLMNDEFPNNYIKNQTPDIHHIVVAVTLTPIKINYPSKIEGIDFCVVCWDWYNKSIVYTC
jgi:hypothetical protein